MGLTLRCVRKFMQKAGDRHRCIGCRETEKFEINELIDPKISVHPELIHDWGAYGWLWEHIAAIWRRFSSIRVCDRCSSHLWTSRPYERPAPNVRKDLYSGYDLIKGLRDALDCTVTWSDPVYASNGNERVPGKCERRLPRRVAMLWKGTWMKRGSRRICRNGSEASRQALFFHRQIATGLRLIMLDAWGRTRSGHYALGAD